MRSTSGLIPIRFLSKFRPIHLDHSILLPTSGILKTHHLIKGTFCNSPSKNNIVLQHLEEHTEKFIMFRDPPEKYPTAFSFRVQVSAPVTASSWCSYPSDSPFTCTGCLSYPFGHNQPSKKVVEVSGIAIMFCFHGLQAGIK